MLGFFFIYINVLHKNMFFFQDKSKKPSISFNGNQGVSWKTFKLMKIATIIRILCMNDSTTEHWHI